MESESEKSRSVSSSSSPVPPHGPPAGDATPPLSNEEPAQASLPQDEKAPPDLRNSPAHSAERRPEPRPAPQRPGSLPPGVRLVRLPQPPALWKRFVMMCLRPETWAESARFSLGSTALVALVAVLLASLLVTISVCYRWQTGFLEFAKSYDQSYSPLILAGDGTLAAKGEWKEPIRYPLSHPSQGWTVVVDPKNSVQLQDETSPAVLLFSRDKATIYFKDSTPSSAPLKNTPFIGFFPKTGEVFEVNSASLTDFALGGGVGLLAIIAFIVFMQQIVANALWVLLVVFVIWPLIVIAASSGQRGLPTPKYIAYRMATAVAVPLVMIGAALEMAGYSVKDQFGPQVSAFGWLIAASGLGIWAGILAKSIFNPVPAKK